MSAPPVFLPTPTSSYSYTYSFLTALHAISPFLLPRHSCRPSCHPCRSHLQTALQLRFLKRALFLSRFTPAHHPTSKVGVVSRVWLFAGPRGLQPARVLCPWRSPGKNTGVGCHALLQGTFPTQGLNPGLGVSPASPGMFFDPLIHQGSPHPRYPNSPFLLGDCLPRSHQQCSGR